MKIRPAKQSDIDEVYLMEREYIIEHEIKQLTKWDAVKERNIKCILDNIHRMFIAVVDNKIVGFSYWSIHDDLPCVFSIYITKYYRRMGIATALIEMIEKDIHNSGYKEMILSTLETNPAQYFFCKKNYLEIYRKNGWINYKKVV